MGLPPRVTTKTLTALKSSLINEAFHAPNNEHNLNEIVCVIPKGSWPEQKIMILVEGLYYNPDRKQRSKKEAAKEMVRITGTFFPSLNIHCLVGPFDHLPGFFKRK